MKTLLIHILALLLPILVCAQSVQPYPQVFQNTVNMNSNVSINTPNINTFKVTDGSESLITVSNKDVTVKNIVAGEIMPSILLGVTTNTYAYLGGITINPASIGVGYFINYSAYSNTAGVVNHISDTNYFTLNSGAITIKKAGIYEVSATVNDRLAYAANNTVYDVIVDNYGNQRTIIGQFDDYYATGDNGLHSGSIVLYFPANTIVSNYISLFDQGAGNEYLAEIQLSIEYVSKIADPLFAYPPGP